MPNFINSEVPGVVSRSVSLMTPVQLYRKRAFDRENQRQSRARKTVLIADLEREIAELRQCLEAARDEIRQLRARDSLLRDVVSESFSKVQDLLGASHSDSHGSNWTSFEPSHQSPSEEILEQIQGTSHNDSTSQVSERALPTLNQSDNPSGISIQDELEISQHSDGLYFSFPFNGWNDLSSLWKANAVDMSTTIEESILNGVALTFPDLSMTDPHASSDEITMSEASGILPPWLRLPMHVEPTTRVESVLLGLINSGREQIHKAGQMAELSEPAFPSVASLLNPDTSNANQLIANGIGNHGKVTMNVPWVPEKIALMYLMCIYVRWLVSPSKHTYESMPKFLRPTEAQLTTPHPIWVDVVVWPEARDLVINNMDWSKFEIFRSTMNSTLCINWSYGPDETFVKLSNNEFMLSTIFEEHIRNVESYKCGPDVEQAFPFFSSIAAIMRVS